MTRLRYSVAGALAGALTVLPLYAADRAFAQPACGPRAQVVKMLTGKYQEVARAAGTIRGNILMEVYTSEKGSWTILITDTMGKACILAAGQAWDELPTPPKGKPS